MTAMTETRLIHIEMNVEIILNEMRRHATLLEEELHVLRKRADINDDVRRRLANIELEMVEQRAATVMLREDLDRYIASRYGEDGALESESEDG